MSRANTITLLIAAMGGEGGGVLSDWIVSAARRQGLAVQATSIPGVAQRTGATSYYIEMAAAPEGPPPVFCLAPMAGDVDVMVATEFLEAGRAIANGYVTPDRTLLIASTHRVFAIAERSAMGDGRFDMGRLFRAAKEHARDTILFDMDEAAKAAQSILNAVLLGAIAGSARLPIPPEAFEEAIREGGKAVDSNLAGFRFGRAHARGDLEAAVARAAQAEEPLARDVAGPLDSIVETYSPSARPLVRAAVRRLTEYQSPSYARLYLDRLRTVREAEENAGGDGALTAAVARHLAVRMSFEDVVRVAQVKVSRQRFDMVTREVGAGTDPFVIVDYFKPGIEEICSLLPPGLARPILAWSARKGWLNRKFWGMEVRTSTVSGFLRVWALSKLRPLRPRSLRYQEEQARIEDWLTLVRRAAARDLRLAAEVADCARLVKGYGETYRRGLGAYDRIVAEVVRPALTGDLPGEVAADAVASACAAALADPEGKRLDETLAAISGRRLRVAAAQ